MIFNICPACNAHAMELTQQCGRCERSWHTANEDGDIDDYVNQLAQVTKERDEARSRILRIKGVKDAYDRSVTIKERKHWLYTFAGMIFQGMLANSSNTTASIPEAVELARALLNNLEKET